MTTVRRWYIYLVSAISLQAVTWAVIALLRNLLLSALNPQPTTIAFQISVIVIGLPVFLAHWRWGQRLAEQSEEERGATLRRFYLYSTMASFLGPFATNVYYLIGALLGVEHAFDELGYRPNSLTSGGIAVYHLLALLVLGVLWLYHQRIVTDDAKAVPETVGSAVARRLYVLGYNVAGLVLTALAAIRLLRWIMLQFGGIMVRSTALDVGLTSELARMVIGLPLWLIFWRWAQQLFVESEEEHQAVLRKIYLYGVVLVGALSVVAYTTAILAGVFRAVLGLPPESDIRVPLPIIIVMGIVWAYHAFVLRNDVAAGETLRQMRVRRLYQYLIAAVGLSALLVGLSGDVSVIIRALDASFGTALKDQLAWFTASTIAGLPVWILPWRQVQDRAANPGPDSADARRSIVRKIYVYVFLFIATMTVLSSAVFVVFKIVGWALGLDAPTLNELGHAIAFIVIAVSVWLYHGSTLRSDHRLSDQDQARRLAALRVVVVDVGDGQFGRAVVNGLKREAPELSLEPIILPHSHSDEEIAAQLVQAGLIVGPWTIGGVGGDATSPAVSQMVADSPARKLLVPTRSQGWDWAGVDRWNTEALVRQTVHAVKRIADGEEAEPVRPLGVGSIIAIGIGVIFALIVILSLIVEVIDNVVM
jgi:hypothetical protein